MPIDLDTLANTLATDSRYDIAVISGKNQDLLALLGEAETGKTVFRSVPKDDVLEAIGDGVRTLTTTQIEMLCLYASGGEVDFRKPAIYAEIGQIFAGNQDVLDRLRVIATRTPSYGEAFKGEVTLRDLWAVLKQIPKSYMATYLARG